MPTGAWPDRTVQLRDPGRGRTRWTHVHGSPVGRPLRDQLAARPMYEMSMYRAISIDPAWTSSRWAPTCPGAHGLLGYGRLVRADFIPHRPVVSAS